MNGSQLDQMGSALEHFPGAHEAFRAELINTNGTDVLPLKAQKALYSKAYEMGHSAGYAEVETVYGDLAELALAVYRATLEQLADDMEEDQS